MEVRRTGLSRRRSCCSHMVAPFDDPSTLSRHYLFATNELILRERGRDSAVITELDVGLHPTNLEILT